MKYFLLFVTLICVTADAVNNNAISINTEVQATSDLRPKRCFPLFSVNVGRTAFVDDQFGNDDTGEVEELGCPFKTIAAAIGAVTEAKGANEIWNIKIRPGNYVSGAISMIDGIEVIGSGIQATTIQGRFRFGTGSYTLRDFTINNTEVGNGAISPNNNMRVFIRNVRAINNVAVSSTGVLNLSLGSYTEIHDSVLESATNNAVGITLRSNSILVGNNLFIKVNGTQLAAAIRLETGSNAQLRNSAAEITLPEDTGNPGAFVIETSSAGSSLATLDNNVVSFFAPTPRVNVPPYGVTISTTVLSHANVFRDRNDNIDTMASTGAVISLADFVDIPVLN